MGAGERYSMNLIDPIHKNDAGEGEPNLTGEGGGVLYTTIFVIVTFAFMSAYNLVNGVAVQSIRLVKVSVWYGALLFSISQPSLATSRLIKVSGWYGALPFSNSQPSLATSRLVKVSGTVPVLLYSWFQVARGCFWTLTTSHTTKGLNPYPTNTFTTLTTSHTTAR
jgi:hypothetical protein